MKKLKILICLFLLAVFAGKAFAITAKVRGLVKDPDGNPIEDVLITIESRGEVSHKYTAKTNKKGEYMHIGVKSGDYRITPSKEGYVPVEYSYMDVTARAGDKPVEADFKMQLASKAQATQQQQAVESEQIKEAKQGVAFLKEGKIDEAIVALNKAIQIDPNMHAVHFNLGLAYESKKQSEEAQKHFQESVKINPDFGEGYLALGNSYLEAKNFEAASEVLSKASGLLSSNYIAFYNLGVAQANSGKYVEAEAAFRKATEINPNDPYAHYQLGMSLLGQSKNTEAKAEFQKYLELNPNAADRKEIEEMLQTLQ
jgi:tetratricopeptide (TPR) repeat protein